MSHVYVYHGIVRTSLYSSAFLCIALLAFFLFFLFMIPPHPRSTLFPYSTLFRSSSGAAEEAAERRRWTLNCLSGWSFLPAQRDRKSTPLNSSHITISYAVFCLKKKTYSHYANQHYTKRHRKIRQQNISSYMDTSN